MAEQTVGLTGFGGYIPRLRLQRKAIAQANAWVAPNFMGKAKGERSMANWDEDSVTMAVEAARDLEATQRQRPQPCRCALFRLHDDAFRGPAQ